MIWIKRIYKLYREGLRSKWNRYNYQGFTEQSLLLVCICYRWLRDLQEKTIHSVWSNDYRTFFRNEVIENYLNSFILWWHKFLIGLLITVKNVIVWKKRNFKTKFQLFALHASVVKRIPPPSPPPPRRRSPPPTPPTVCEESGDAHWRATRAHQDAPPPPHT